MKLIVGKKYLYINTRDYKPLRNKTYVMITGLNDGDGLGPDDPTCQGYFIDDEDKEDHGFYLDELCEGTLMYASRAMNRPEGFEHVKIKR